MPACVQLLEQRYDLVGGAAVERAGRLVGKQDMRIVDQCPRDRHALLLAAGKLGRLVPGPLGETDARQARLRLLARVALVRTMRIEDGSATLSSAVVRASRLKVWNTKPMRLVAGIAPAHRS